VGMATKLLQLANSAFIGVHGRVSSLSQAVSLIGVETVRVLTLSIHVFSRFERGEASAAWLAALWEHSVCVATLAQRIAAAETGDKAMSEECFAAGLLHDVGKVILLGERPKEYREILARLGQETASIETVETEVLGCSHAQLGAYLMSMWGLPTSLVHAVAYHHCPSAAIDLQFSPLAAIHCADAIAHHVADGEEKAVFDESYLERLGLSGKAATWRNLLDEI